MNLVLSADPAALADEAVARFEIAADLALASRGRFSVALTGGRTASPLYGRLAGAHVEWSRVVLLQAHDRSVPLYDDEGRGVSHRMLMGWLEMPVGDGDLGRALGEHRRIDLVHLGLLPDGRLDSSLTDPYLADAREVWLIATGAQVADALRRILEDPDCDWPAAQLVRSGRVVCFADRLAAAHLSATVPSLPAPASFL